MTSHSFYSNQIDAHYSDGVKVTSSSRLAAVVPPQNPQLMRKVHFFFTIAFFAWTVLLICQLINLLVFNSPGHDQNWFLYAAQRLLAGAKPDGPLLQLTNPPLIAWLSVLPVLIARLLHIAPDQVLKLLVFVMIGGSIAWSIRIFRIAGWARLPVSAHLAVYSLLTAEFWIRGEDFGQREHLVIILVLPYILSAASGAAAKLSFYERCAIGFLGGIAVCFKPQQVLIIIGLEFFLASGTVVCIGC